jgi:CRISPR-associated endonuclease Csn1
MTNNIINDKKYGYKLGLDIGTSSIGWAIVKFKFSELEKKLDTYENIIAMGSRIFSNSREPSKNGGLGLSLAANRTAARQMRRQIDRKRGRRMALLYALQNMGLMPSNADEAKALKTLNPYELRSKGIDDKLDLHHLGRALFHLQQRRGFKSSRKEAKKVTVDADGNVKAKSSDADGGSVKTAIKNFKDNMHGKTLGQVMYAKIQAGASVLSKPIMGKNKDGKDTANIVSYENRFERAMVLAEFNALWDAQSKYYPQILTAANKQDIENKIFFQRPLKDAMVGLCTFEKGQTRAALCLPSTELYRIWSEVHNAYLKPTIHNIAGDELALTFMQKEMIVDALQNAASISCKDIIDILYPLPANIKKHMWKLNLDTSKASKIKGANTYSQLMRILDHNTCEEIGLAKLDRLVALIWQDNSVLNDEQIKYIKTARMNIDELDAFFTSIIAQEYAQYNINGEVLAQLLEINLVDDYSSLSSKAMYNMLAKMSDEVAPHTQYEAKIACGYHDNTYTNEIGLTELPYYGEVVGQYCIPQKNLFDMLNNKALNLDENRKLEIAIGKITNPSVHVALNEIRKVVNALLKQYAPIFKDNDGKPDAIHIELARDLCLGQESVDAIISEQNKNEKKRDVLKAKLNTEFGMVATRDNMLKLELYYELLDNMANPCCVYKGNELPKNEQEFKIYWNDWEVDHILPYSKSFDDSKANKLLVSKDGNQEKGNKTPWEWINSTQNEAGIEAFMRRVNSLPKIKSGKGSKAVEKSKAWRCLEAGVKYLQNKKDQDPQARLLNDTRYMAKVAKMYLESLYNLKENGKEHRQNKVVAIPSGSITAKMRKEWKLDELLWTEQQLANRKEVKSRLKPLQEQYDLCKQSNWTIGMSNEDLHELEMLKSIKNIPMDNALYAHLMTLDAKIRIASSDKEKDELYKEFKSAHKKLKNRNDNRHHALDAVMIAIADKSLVKHISYTNKIEDEDDSRAVKNKQLDKIVQRKPNDLKEHLQAKIAKIVVSHKPDHGTQARLHEETARCAIENEKGEKKFVYYNKEKIAQDPINESSVVGVADAAGNVYKYYKKGSNYCLEIHKDAEGKYKGEIISTFTANQKVYQAFMQDKKQFMTKTFSGQELVNRFMIGDMLKCVVDGVEKYFYIQKFSPDGLVFNEHFESNCDARNRAKLGGEALIMNTASANALLTKWQAKKILVNPIGRIYVVG